MSGDFSGTEQFFEKGYEYVKVADYADKRAKNITSNLYSHNQPREFEHTKPYSRELRPLSSIITSGIRHFTLLVFCGSYTS